MAIAGYTRQAFEQKLPQLLTPTTPIRSPEFLLGRERILEDIRRAFVQPGRHVFIHGDRGVGKTSLAQTAALEHHTAKSAPIFLGCDNSSTFYSIMRSLATRLRSGDPTATLFTKQSKASAGWQGFVSAEFQKTIQHGAIPEFKSVDDVISVVGYLADQYAEQPVVVVDEFERIQNAAERMLFADFIKQCGDQSVPIRLLFCGIGGSRSDHLDAHHSCYRYLTAAPLERLAWQPRLDIISKATQAFGLDVEMNTAYRIAQISDGFPHYIHLISEKLLWQVFEDPKDIATTMPWHYSEAIKKAVIDIEPHLKGIYEKATLKYKADYETVLWAVADDSQLKRRSTDIYNSYVRIMRSLGDDPLPRETFNQRINSLKKVSYSSILSANRQGWYEFTEAVVRGYVRLRAEARGVQLGNDHPLDGRSPGALGNTPESNVYRSRE